MSMELHFPPFAFTDLSADSFRAFFVHCYRNLVSDIYLQGGSFVVVKLHGRRLRASAFRLEPSQLARLIDEAFAPEVNAEIRAGHAINRPLQLAGDMNNRYGLARGEKVRFRCNFGQAHIADVEIATTVSIRVLQNKIPELTSMGIEEALFRSLLPSMGLGLICGGVGSGKSTLLAAIYQYCCQVFPDLKIITGEDPIEYVLSHLNAILPPEQFQLGRDFSSYATFLAEALRRDPNIVGVSEIRTREALEGAVACAMTHLLCLSTLHVNSPGEAISRSLNMLPVEQREAGAYDLLSILQYIVVQRLVRTTDGRRRALREYVIFDEDTRLQLAAMNYQKWGAWLNAGIKTRRARITDQTIALWKEKQISHDEMVSVIGPANLHIYQREGIL